MSLDSYVKSSKKSNKDGKNTSESINKQNESNYDFPIFYLSELVALAFGFKPEELGFNFHRIRPTKLFESIKFTP